MKSLYEFQIQHAEISEKQVCDQMENKACCLILIVSKSSNLCRKILSCSWCAIDLSAKWYDAS